MTEKEIKALEQTAIAAAITWAKSSYGYYTMARLTNDYIDTVCATSTSTDGTEAIKFLRLSAAGRIATAAIQALTPPQLLRLVRELNKIAEQLPTNNPLHTLNSVNPVKPLNSLDSKNAVKAVNPKNPLKAKHTMNPLKPVNPLNAVYPLNPSKPVNPQDAMKPLNAVLSLVTSKLRKTEVKS